MNEDKKLMWVEYIRAKAIGMIVILHAAAPIMFRYETTSLNNWWVGNIYGSMVRMGIPLLFMITGYLLLTKDDSSLEFFIKRVQKITIPLIVWSLFYIAWNVFYKKDTDLTAYTFYSVFFSPAHYHLWFFYALVGMYLFIPILRIIVRYATVSMLYYFIALWFLSAAILPFAEKAIDVINVIDLKMVTGYVGYLLLGYLLGHRYLSKRLAVASLIMLVTMIAITAYGTFHVTTVYKGRFFGYFYDFLSPNVIILSAASFVLLKFSFEHIVFLQNPFFTRIITVVSSTSFGVYIIHIAILDLLKNGHLGFIMNNYYGNSFFFFPLSRGARISYFVYHRIWFTKDPVGKTMCTIILVRMRYMLTRYRA